MANDNRYYFKISGNPAQELKNPILFVYTTENNDEHGTYVAHCADPDRQQYWSDWLDRTHYTPSMFMRRFGYLSVDAGKIHGDEHLDELLSSIGIEKRSTVNSKSLAWVAESTNKFLAGAPELGFKAGVYTKPELRERIKNRIMAGDKGGKPGQWSARKAQLLAVEYAKAGGGYSGKPRKTQRSLKKWTREKWTTSDGKPAIRKGGTRRYLPAAAWKRLSPGQRQATNAKKAKGSRSGNQFVANTEAAARVSRNARD